jgi:hypothetical protein
MSNPASGSVSRELSAPLSEKPVQKRMTARKVARPAFNVEQVTLRDMLESFGRMAQWFQQFSLPETDDTAAWELVQQFPDKISQLAEAMKAGEWDTAFKSGGGESAADDETVRLPINCAGPL